MPTLSGTLPPAFTDRAGAAWRWWTGELRGLLPAAAEARLFAVPSADIVIGAAGVVVERREKGRCERFEEVRSLQELDEEGWEEIGGLIAGRRARIVLAPPLSFALKLALPAAARGRLRSAVALQLDHAAPVAPEALAWTCAIEEVSGGEIGVRVAMARRETLSWVQDMFDANGIAPPEVAVRVGDRSYTLAPGVRSLAERGRRAKTRGFALAFALAASLPVTSWAGAALLASIEQRRAERLAAAAAPLIARERAAAREEQVRRALKSVFELPSATAAIENLALGLPDSAYAVSAERRYDGTFSFEAQAEDRAALENQMAETPLLARLNAAAEAPGEEGRIQLSYRGALR
jgi:hypothetical protein